MKMKRTSSGVALYKIEVIMQLSATLLPDPVAPAMSRCGIRSRSVTKGFPLISFPKAKVSLDGDLTKHIRFDELAEHDEFAMAVGDFNADGRFSGNPVNANGFGLDAKAQVIHQPGNSGIFDAGVRLEFEGRHHRSGMDLRDAAVYVKFRALIGYHARTFHQNRFIDGEGIVRRTEQFYGRKMKFARARAIGRRRRQNGPAPVRAIRAGGCAGRFSTTEGGGFTGAGRGVRFTGGGAAAGLMLTTVRTGLRLRRHSWKRSQRRSRGMEGCWRYA